LFTWKKSRGGKVANSICGRIDTSGHRQITINNRSYLAHRIAIFIKNGSWPKNQIDHINGNKDDNRIINLRECSASQNQQNSKKRIDNKSGVKGVSWHNGRKNWVCQLQINKKKIHVGEYKKFEDAVSAIKIAREKIHKEYANHG
jgi:hypothetical protein